MDDVFGLHAGRLVPNADEFHDRLRADPVLAEAMAFCADHGIPLSIFLGRAYPNPLDPTEPLWRPQDTSDALGYRIWLMAVCPSCGLHERDWENEREQPYMARALLCNGCKEVIEANKEYVDHETPQAVHMRLVHNDEGEAI